MTPAKLNATCVAITLALTANGGTIDDVIKQELDSIDLNEATKADPIVDLVKLAIDEQGRYKAEAEAIAAKAKVAERCAANLKDYLFNRMTSGQIERLDGLRHVVRIQDSPLSVKWEGKGDPPKEFQRVKIEPNLMAAKAHYEQGHPLPPGFTASRGKHLVIAS